ncbi:MAG TPA: tetratricopeptide repeat protein, partial [Ktedonobacteraceae bacterium]|nr:tetratricopeptide repeat protein [Ktedonobacteraceae bacterium]
DPSSLDALLYLAELFHMNYGRGYAAALPVYQQILHLKPTNKEFTIAAYFGIGCLHYAPGSPVSYTDALAAFEHAVETDPQRADAHHNLGTALLRKGNRERARKEFLLAEQLSRQQGQPTEGIQSMLDMIDKNEPITHSFLINHSTLFRWPQKE